jgi:hypothetical protein
MHPQLLSDVPLVDTSLHQSLNHLEILRAQHPGREPMKKRSLLKGENDRLTPIPEQGWMEELLASPPQIARRLEFMTADHHRIRNLAVTRVAAAKGPVPVDWLAGRLAMTPTEVDARLDELERGLFFGVG